MGKEAFDRKVQEVAALREAPEEAAYSVSKRLKELGIRIALGAQRKEVLRAALGRAFKLLAFGSAAGLILGILSSRVLASIVYQATPRDPLVWPALF